LGHHRIGNADGLENPHRFAVKMNAPRNVINLRRWVDHQRGDIVVGQHIGGHRTGWSKTGNYNIIINPHTLSLSGRLSQFNH